MNIHSSRKQILMRISLYAICAFLIVIASLLGLMCYMGVFNGNVRVVKAGDLYRSGQLRGDHLRRVLQSDHIRSVINLQGYLPKFAGLNYERSLCKEMGIKHVDIKLSACKLPPPEALRQLIKSFDTLPRPILVHCAGGSDRSGLACTLYANICEGVPLLQAERSQLTWQYGHLSFSKAHAMDDFFSLYRKTAHGQPIREWILTKYPQIYRDHT